MQSKEFSNLAFITYNCRLLDKVGEAIAGLRDPASTKEDAIRELLELARVIHEAIAQQSI